MALLVSTTPSNKGSLLDILFYFFILSAYTCTIYFAAYKENKA